MPGLSTAKSFYIVKAIGEICSESLLLILDYYVL